LRTDLTIGVLLSEQCVIRVARPCYRYRVVDERTTRPPRSASQIWLGRCAPFSGLSTWAPPEDGKRGTFLRRVTCRGWREVVRARRDGFGDGPAVRAIHIELAPYVGALQQSLQLSIV